MAIGFIFMCTAAAWMILGGFTLTRTDDSRRSLTEEVKTLFGGPLNLHTPMVYTHQSYRVKTANDREEVIETVRARKRYAKCESSRIRLHVSLDPRRKGVLWFPTFRCAYDAEHIFSLPPGSDRRAYLYASLESSDAVYDHISLKVNQSEVRDITPLVRKRSLVLDIDPADKIKVHLSFETTGLEKVLYLISPQEKDVAEISDFLMTLTTDFRNIDFPASTISPTAKQKAGRGWELTWDFKRSITGKDIGLIIPSKLNPGEIVGRVSFFAPVSLLFYLMVVIVLSLLQGIRIHPMNYFFISAAFFSFHLMYSYFSDHLDIFVTFAIASLVSMGLTASYLKIFTPSRFAFGYSALAQFIYLVVFSFSFFFKGITGLIVTVAAVITLFVLMQVTGRLDWDEILSIRKDASRLLEAEPQKG
jgi:hypothetical protein